MKFLLWATVCAAALAAALGAQQMDRSMLMGHRHGWMWMTHGSAFLTDQQQSGPRGGDKLFSTNWWMGSVSHPWGPGRVTFETMLSLEPITVTGEQYPLLFQLGETAHGRPIVDGQHPHNFLMELSARYDWRGVSLTLAPVGNPAIGPAPFPHRASAADNPLAPLGHHQEDSTHIAGDVVTLGLHGGQFLWEASTFHGREPGENRWAVPSGGLDSWATRLTWSPNASWSAQYSIARIHSPEALEPSESQLRVTASATHHRAWDNGSWDSTLLWGRTRVLGARNILNSYLFESDLVRDGQHVWARIENADRTGELIGLPETFLARVQAFSFGYGHDVPSLPNLPTEIGAQWTAYRTPSRLDATYGANPQGIALFVRVRLGRSH